MTTAYSAQGLAHGKQQSASQLKRDLRTSQLRKKWMAIGLIAPLAIFLLITFIVPIAVLLVRAIENPEIATTLPKTVTTLAHWNKQNLPDEDAFIALSNDLLVAKENNTGGSLARRMNAEIPGARSVVMKTVRAMPLLDSEGQPLPAQQIKPALIALDEQWGQLKYWHVIAKNGARYSPYYLLASLDLKQDSLGHLEKVDEEQAG